MNHLLNLLFYFLFYFEGSTWGITPVNARYYTECTLLGIIPLVARPSGITRSRICRMPILSISSWDHPKRGDLPTTIGAASTNSISEEETPICMKAIA
jgi:hypothetical protein